MWPEFYDHNYDRNDSAIVIYNHNSSDQYYITMIFANLALARNVNYNLKVRCKLKCSL